MSHHRKINDILAGLAKNLYWHELSLGAFFAACEREVPYLIRGRQRGSLSWWTVRLAYNTWLQLGRPSEHPQLRQQLTEDLVRDLSQGVTRRSRRQRVGNRLAKANRATVQEIHVMHSCGCTEDPEWMRLDAHGNLREEEVAIIKAKAYYHECPA